MKKGERTKEQILEKAIEVFRDGGFENGSILMIASRLGIRNSTIYRYFDNKEDIYNELAKMFKNGLLDRIKSSINENLDIPQNISNITRAYISYIKENTALYDTFREVEFVNLRLAKEYYRELTGIIKAQLDKKAREDIDTESVSYAIVGSIYFVVINEFIWGNGTKKPPEEIIPFILNGIDIGKEFTPYLIPEKKCIDTEKTITSRGEATRKNILKSAENLFGKYGYNKTHTVDIARACGIGTGTIYLYFKSKKEILSNIVKHVNHLLRLCSSEYIRDYSDRRAVENAGFQAFFNLFKTRGDDYRIVREAEFIDRSIGVWYYKRIAESYIKGLEEGVKRGEIINIDPVILSYALMGVGHTVGIKWYVIEKKQSINENSILSVLHYIMHGVNGILKEEG